MSASTKKKHVFLEAINNFTLPTQNQSIVRIKGPRGNNLHDVETPSGENYIVTMPVKFRKSVWTKRGDYVIIESIEEGNKVKAEIIHILNKEQIRYMKSQNVWPKEFETIDEDEKESQSYVSKDMLPSSSDEEEDQEEEEVERTEDKYNENKDVNFNQKRLNQNDLF